MFDSISDNLWESDKDHRFISMSSDDDILTYDEGIGKCRWDFPGFQIEGITTLEDHIAALNNFKTFKKFSFSYLGRDGMRQYCSTSGQPQFDSDGIFLGHVGFAVDLTHQVSIERELKKSREFLRTILDAVPVGITVKDAAGRMNMVNKTFCDWMQLDQSQMIGEIAYDIRHPDDVEKIRERDRNVIETGSDSIEEIQRMFPDHVHRALISHKRAVSFPGSQTSQVMSILMDVSDYKRTKEQLNDREADLTRLFDNLPIMIYRVDKNECFVLINGTAEKWYGMSQEEIAGKPVKEVVDADVYKKIQPFIAQVLSGEVASFDTPVIYPDGQERHVDVVYVPEIEQSGEVIGYIGTVVDVTEKKQLEEIRINAHNELERMVEKRTAELEKSRKKSEAASELFTKAFHASPALFSISTLEGRHLEVNEIWSTVTGFSRDEALQKSARELGIWAVPEQREEYVEQLKNKGFVREYEMVLRTKSGALKDMIYSSELINYQGQDCLLVVGQDITEKKELDRIKSEFISAVSHELRTPLTAIRGSLGMIESGVLTNPEDSSQLIKLASKNTLNLISLVDDLLDIGKLQSGEMEILFEKVSLPEIVKESIDINKPYADEYDVKFILKEVEADAIVFGDRNRLGQVLTNLLSNAAKFSPKFGEVEISVICREESVYVSVCDTGPGVPGEFRNRIFERFTQADSKDNREKRGTGLGLNISKSIVELHKGEIDFVSNTSGGSTFYFTLPKLK